MRAQSATFNARRTEILRQATAARDRAQLNGEANRKKLYRLYPTPEIVLAKPVAMAAGSTAAVSIVGTFSDKTTFVSYSDGVELTNVVVAANSFKATISASAGLPPHWARIYAFAPVSGAEAWIPAVFIGSPLTFNLTVANGWTIKLTLEAPAFWFPKPGTAAVTYRAEFFEPGATTPFETTTGSLTLEAESGPGSYTFMMSPGNSGSDAAEIQHLTIKQFEFMQEGEGFGSAEFAAIQKQLNAARARLAKAMDAQIKDPAAAQKQQDDFGCKTINLSIRSGQVSGSVSCGKNVGSSLSLTGK